MKERYDDIVALSEVPSLQNGGKGSFFVAVDPSCKIRFTVYVDGKGYIGLYSYEKGTYEAYKDGSEADSRGLSGYYNYIFCQPDEYYATSAYWSYAAIAYSLGIS